MASHKKRFLFYNDWLDYLWPMWIEEKAEFLETILKYQNGENVSPTTWFRFVRPRIRAMMDIDREARDKRADIARSNWSNWWRPKKTKENPAGYSETKTNPEKPVNVNVNVNVNDNKSIDILSQSIINFQEMRKKIKKPMTENAVKLLLWELEKLAPWDNAMKVAILNKSILNCRQWVFPLKEEDKKAMQDPLLVEYERQVWLCYEAWWANDSYNEKLSEIMERLIEKYWKDEAMKIRKDTRKKICW